MRGRGTGELEGTAHVGVEDAIPDLDGERLQLGERDADVPGGIVDQNVQPAELAGRARHRAVDGSRLGLVELDGARAAAEALDEPHGLRGTVAVADVADGHVAAGARQRLAGGSAEVAGAARHEGGAPVQVHQRGGGALIAETCALTTFQPRSGKRTHVWL